MGAAIYLDDGKQLEVNESVDEIFSQITSIEAGTTPVVRLTEFGPYQQPALVLASRISMVKDLG